MAKITVHQGQSLGAILAGSDQQQVNPQVKSRVGAKEQFHYCVTLLPRQREPGVTNNAHSPAWWFERLKWVNIFLPRYLTRPNFKGCYTPNALGFCRKFILRKCEKKLDVGSSSFQEKAAAGRIFSFDLGGQSKSNVCIQHCHRQKSPSASQ